jgi:hypothetical protein
MIDITKIGINSIVKDIRGNLFKINDYRDFAFVCTNIDLFEDCPLVEQILEEIPEYKRIEDGKILFIIGRDSKDFPRVVTFNYIVIADGNKFVLKTSEYDIDNLARLQSYFLFLYNYELTFKTPIDNVG